MLNVGPKATGEFPEESIKSLREIGAWMKINGEAVYSTQGSPLAPLSWGRCTRKEQNGNTILYLSVFDWPTNGKLVVPGINNKVVSAKLLATGKSLKISGNNDGLVIETPAKSLDPIATVIKVEINGLVSVSE